MKQLKRINYILLTMMCLVSLIHITNDHAIYPNSFDILVPRHDKLSG